MQLEELGTSKDVPPLSSREAFELSTFVANRVVKLNTTKNSCIIIGSVFARRIQSNGSHKVPD
jgi:hypothetical protein